LVVASAVCTQSATALQESIAPDDRVRSTAGGSLEAPFL